jgi:hypothetical protein
MRAGAQLRSFTLLDALVIVAALAVGFALARWQGVILSPSFATRSPFELFLIRLRNVGRLITPILFCLSVATLVSGMVPPGFPRRWRIRSPGMIACLSVTLVVCADGFWYLILHVARIRSGVLLGTVIMTWQAQATCAVIASWTTLWLVGRWRSGPSWPDRLGRIIGGTWISLELITRACMTVIYVIQSY